MTDKTIESKTADVILQRCKEVVIGSKTYQVPRPTLATLVLVSEEISKMPDLDTEKGKSKIIASLAHGANAPIVARILAILVVGGKAVVKGRRHPLMPWRRVNPAERMADIIMTEMTPRDITQAVTDILLDMQLGDFFDITTFLTEVNLTKRTKVEKPTPPGRQ